GDIADAEFDARMADAHDVIVSTTGPSRTGGDHRIWLDGLSTLAEASGTTRLFVVGGAGSLFVGDTMLKDTPGFPSAYKAESETGTQALELLRAANPSPWTLISPAPEIAPGERTGTYRTELEVPAGDAISAEDFAVAMVDEILEPHHIAARCTVANCARRSRQLGRSSVATSPVACARASQSAVAGTRAHTDKRRDAFLHPGACRLIRACDRMAPGCQCLRS